MKKSTLLAAVAIVMVALSSCQKDPDIDLPPQTAGLKLKTYTEDYRSTSGDLFATFRFTYDGSDRITSMVDTANAGNKFVFAYPSSSKFTMDIFGNNQFIIHADYFLNGQSLIDSSFQYNNTDDSITEKYLYNAAKQVTKLYEYDYSKITGSDLWNTTTYTYDAAGDLIKSEDTDDYVYTYEYYTDKLVLMPQTTPFVSGANQKAHLPKKLTLTESGIVTASATYIYTFDTKDRLSTVTQDVSNGDVVIKTYTYVD